MAMTTTTDEKVLNAIYLGVVPYGRALELQQSLMQARAEGSTSDILLLLQHPPVFTVGRFRGEEDLLVPPKTLEREGIAVFHTSRGGSITYHGSGQLVGYPVLDLRENGLGVREYIWKLEEVVIRLLLAHGVCGNRSAEHPGGVWVDEKKVCSIGIRVSRHITMHGFALNVSNDLRYFRYINPCGLSSETMTSLTELTGRNYNVEAIAGDLPHIFAGVFGLKCERGNSRCLVTSDDLSG